MCILNYASTFPPPNICSVRPITCMPFTKSSDVDTHGTHRPKAKSPSKSASSSPRSARADGRGTTLTLARDHKSVSIRADPRLLNPLDVRTERIVAGPASTKVFAFSHVFSARASPSKLFDVSAGLQLDRTLDGETPVLLLYGSRRSRKNEVFFGGDLGRRRGLLQRSIERLLVRCARLREVTGRHIRMFVSAHLLSGDVATDCFAGETDTADNARALFEPGRGVYFAGSARRGVATLHDILGLIHELKQLRSRNPGRHLAVTVQLEQIVQTGRASLRSESSTAPSVSPRHADVFAAGNLVRRAVGSAHIVDLAAFDGLEAQAQLRARRRLVGDLQKLESVLVQIAKPDAPAQFRACKLSYLLKGATTVSVVVTASRERSMLHPTVTALRFASRLQVRGAGRTARSLSPVAPMLGGLDDGSNASLDSDSEESRETYDHRLDPSQVPASPDTALDYGSRSARAGPSSPPQWQPRRPDRDDEALAYADSKRYRAQYRSPGASPSKSARKALRSRTVVASEPAPMPRDAPTPVPATPSSTRSRQQRSLPLMPTVSTSAPQSAPKPASSSHTVEAAFAVDEREMLARMGQALKHMDESLSALSSLRPPAAHSSRMRDWYTNERAGLASEMREEAGRVRGVCERMAAGIRHGEQLASKLRAEVRDANLEILSLRTQLDKARRRGEATALNYQEAARALFGLRRAFAPGAAEEEGEAKDPERDSAKQDMSFESVRQVERELRSKIRALYGKVTEARVREAKARHETRLVETEYNRLRDVVALQGLSAAIERPAPRPIVSAIATKAGGTASGLASAETMLPPLPESSNGAQQPSVQEGIAPSKPGICDARVEILPLGASSDWAGSLDSTCKSAGFVRVLPGHFWETRHSFGRPISVTAWVRSLSKEGSFSINLFSSDRGQYGGYSLELGAYGGSKIRARTAGKFDDRVPWASGGGRADAWHEVTIVAIGHGRLVQFLCDGIAVAAREDGQLQSGTLQFVPGDAPMEIREVRVRTTRTLYIYQADAVDGAGRADRTPAVVI